MVGEARDKRRKKQLEDRRLRTEQENAAAIVNAQREDNIRGKEKSRDQQFALKVQEMKSKEKDRQLELEAKKIQRRLQEKENAIKVHEEEQQRRRQLVLLEEQREAMIRERTLERNRREQERFKGKEPGAAEGGDGDAAVEDAAAAETEVDAPGALAIPQ